MISPVAAHQHCLSCDTPLSGRFCPACGEPAVHEGDLALKHLNHDFLHEFTHVDGKIWRTLRALLFEPGRLTAEYWAGRRGMWIRPLRIYLVVTALQLLLAANASGPLGMRVWAVHNAQTGDDNYTVGQGIAPGSKGTPVTEEVNHRIQEVYLWVRYLSLGAFAAASLLFFRKKQPFYGAHLIFALHFYSFESILSGLFIRLAPTASPAFPLTVTFIYLWLALRRVYRQGILITSAKTIGLTIAVLVTEAFILALTVLSVTKLWPTH